MWSLLSWKYFDAKWSETKNWYCGFCRSANVDTSALAWLDSYLHCCVCLESHMKKRLESTEHFSAEPTSLISGRTGFLNRVTRSPSAPRGDSPETFTKYCSSAVILQNPIDEHGATSLDSLWKGTTKHESLRTTEVECGTVARKSSIGWLCIYAGGSFAFVQWGLDIQIWQIFH